MDLDGSGRTLFEDLGGWLDKAHMLAFFMMDRSIIDGLGIGIQTVEQAGLYLRLIL
jgi:hypothetical protein